MFLQLTSKGAADESAFTLDASSPFNNFEDRCGKSMAELQNISLELESFPFKVKRKQQGMDVTISLKASAASGSGGQKQDVEILKIEAVDEKGVVVGQAGIDRIIRPQVVEQVGKNSSSGKSFKVPTATTLKNLSSEGPYKGILCGLGFELGLETKNSDGEIGKIQYGDPVPSAINPFAAKSTYETEIGSEKVFKTSVEVVSTIKDWIQDRKKIELTTTVRKVDPSLKAHPLLAGIEDVPDLRGTVAYEIENTLADNIESGKLGISKKRVFFINTEKREIVAIVNYDDKADKDGNKNPPIILAPKKTSGSKAEESPKKVEE